MSADRPTRDDLRRGMTVEIDQEGSENDQPLRGDIRVILSDERTEPGGIKVKLESGVVGRVRRIAPEE